MIQCLSIEKSSFRLKKMILKPTPYLQTQYGLDSIIFTDDGDNYIKTLINTYGDVVDGEITSEYFVPTDGVKERYEKLKSLEFNYEDAINNLEDYSVFVYYGFISENTKSKVLSLIYPEYKNISNSYLDTVITEYVKSIRKEFLSLSISYKGKPVVANDTTLSRISFIISSLSSNSNKTIPFRFEDGSFSDIGLDDVMGIQNMLMGYIQKIMTGEEQMIKSLTTMSSVEKEEFIKNGISNVKLKFDQIVKDVKW